jgi:hypothetical protein
MHNGQSTQVQHVCKMNCGIFESERTFFFKLNLEGVMMFIDDERFICVYIVD